MVGIKNYFSRNFDGLLPRIRELNSKNITCSISFFPKSGRTATDVKKNVEAYIKLLESIANEKLNANVTIKLNQLGIYFDKKLTRDSLMQIVEYSKNLNIFVWVDMEIKGTINDSLEIFQEIYQKYQNTGICLQTYLKRTETDMHTILVKKIPLRLVKGFYNDSEFSNWNDVTLNFKNLMEHILKKSDLPAIATHDKELIIEAKKIIKKHAISKAELQFFDGVSNDEALKAAKEGFNVRLYMAYGNLFPYLKDVLPKIDMSRAVQRILGIKKIR